MENLIKMDDLGVPLFSETSIFLIISTVSKAPEPNENHHEFFDWGATPSFVLVNPGVGGAPGHGGDSFAGLFTTEFTKAQGVPAGRDAWILKGGKGDEVNVFVWGGGGVGM